MDIRQDILLEIYTRMVYTRVFSERINELFLQGIMHGTTHLSSGEEASGIASCMALDEGDFTTSTHRGHSHAIGRGIEINKIMAELFGKVTGCSHGKGGSMHIADFDRGHIGSNGVVGGGFAIATGAALTQKMKKTGKVVLCFFGDGASNEGSFHESINMASVWELPVIFFCENNLYAVSTPTKKSMNIENVATRAKSYDIPSYIIDGNDAIEVYKTTKEAVEYCRNGKGPIMIESKTYRYLGHSKSDTNQYRSDKEIEYWMEKDPIKRLKKHLLENNIADAEQIEKIHEKAMRDIDLAVEFAKNSPNPTLDTLTEDIYA